MEVQTTESEKKVTKDYNVSIIKHDLFRYVSFNDTGIPHNLDSKMSDSEKLKEEALFTNKPKKSLEKNKSRQKPLLVELSRTYTRREIQELITCASKIKEILASKRNEVTNQVERVLETTDAENLSDVTAFVDEDQLAPQEFWGSVKGKELTDNCVKKIWETIDREYKTLSVKEKILKEKAFSVYKHKKYVNNTLYPTKQVFISSLGRLTIPLKITFVLHLKKGNVII